jgi:hypothetical protein
MTGKYYNFVFFCRCKLSSDNLDKLLKIRLATEELNLQEVLQLWKQEKNRQIFKK